MTIKEVEGQSGMTRANIRFYEAEGLLFPARAENGYRDYSEQDIEILKKIQLLRSLHITLEEIKELHAGEKELVEVLEQHEEHLTQETLQLQKSQEICQLMQKDKVSYSTLNAQKYLERLSQEVQSTAEELKQDALPPVAAPWQRYFARCIDLMIYGTIWGIIKLFVFQIQIDESLWILPDTLFSVLLLFLLEPLFLSLWCTTPGKIIFGLKVVNDNGGRLTYGKAFERTWSVMWYGMGFLIPFLDLYRLYRAYEVCKEGKGFDWEYDSELILKDQKKRRFIGVPTVYILLVGISVLAVLAAETPKHKGDITVAQFAENYNRYADYYNLDISRLNQDGEWKDSSLNYESTFKIEELPHLEVIEDNGVMTGLKMKVEVTGNDEIISAYQEEMMVAVRAFIGAQEECGLYSSKMQYILEDIEKNPFSGLEASAYDVEVIRDYDFYGYEYSGNYMFAGEEEGAFYYFTFTMSK